jgi:hypothetical protein
MDIRSGYIYSDIRLKNLPTVDSVMVTLIKNSNDQLIHNYKHMLYHARSAKKNRNMIIVR